MAREPAEFAWQRGRPRSAIEQKKYSSAKKQSLVCLCIHTWEMVTVVCGLCVDCGWITFSLGVDPGPLVRLLDQYLRPPRCEESSIVL
jgi:hypothetical protein